MSGIGPWVLCGRLRPVAPVGPRRFACERNVAYAVSYDYGFVRPSRERRPRLNPSYRAEWCGGSLVPSAKSNVWCRA